MFVTMKDILTKAKADGYGVVAPNVFNRESVEACFQIASEVRSPLILDVVVEHGIEESAYIAKYYERKFPEVPVALNLDHGSNYDQLMLAIRSGYTSIMVDRSTLPFDENVREVSEAVKMAHSLKMSVEAELGHVGQGFEYEKTRDAGLTRPEEATRFVELTGVDCLAVAVGSSHGVYVGEPRIEFDLLDILAKEVPVPLVLHGGSGTGDKNLAEAVRHGIQKVNMFTDLSFEAIKYMNAYEADKEKFKKDTNWELDLVGESPRLCELFKAGIMGYKEKVGYYMELFGSTNRW